MDLITQNEFDSKAYIVIDIRELKFKRNFYSTLYHLCYIFENTFLQFKRWCGIATHDFKNSIDFRASILLVCLFQHFYYPIYLFIAFL